MKFNKEELIKEGYIEVKPGFWKRPKSALLFCVDCQSEDFIYFMVTNEIWKIIKGKSSILCIHCVEKRLGRKLTINDFTDASINELIFYGYHLKS